MKTQHVRAFRIVAVYMYTESSGLQGGEEARLISPNLPDDGEMKCLRFRFTVRGLSPFGALHIKDQNGFKIWSFTASEKGNRA